MKRRANFPNQTRRDGDSPVSFLTQGDNGSFSNCWLGDVCGTSGTLYQNRLSRHLESDALVVKELSQLSFGERKGIEEEIHGVAGDLVEETPELIEDSLAQMQVDVDLIRKKSAYELAFFLSPSYVQDRGFRLCFLRADRFDTSAAARRFVKYFDAKLYFWGQDLLCRDCTWEDLSEDDRAACNTGSIWFSNKYDQSGRRITWICQQLEKYANYKNQIRNVWYQLMHAVKDEHVQRKGFVKVVFNVGMEGMPNMDADLFLKGAPTIFEALPFRMVAMHFCYDDPMMRAALNGVQHVIGRSGRIRFRAHYGSFLECQYALVTFGIPKSHIPFDASGKLELWKIHGHIEGIRKLEKEAEYSGEQARTIIPTVNDVLLGRGKPFQSYQGNIKLGLIIDQYRERYLQAGRCDKAIISQHVVDVVHGYNGRFLKRSESRLGEWVEVSHDAACDKVGHGFRAKPKRSSMLPSDQQNTNPQERQDWLVPTMGRRLFSRTEEASPTPTTKQTKRQRAGSVDSPL